MKNLFKKIIASFMCFSLLTLQATFAEGTFAEDKVLNDVNGQGGAIIKDHTDGLTGIDSNGTNASLTFGKDTVINWDILNVLQGQHLDFNNGGFAVLNNVLNGMSTFAGKISGDTGAIIIANPNGMLMTGGSIETSGALLLTTQNLPQNIEDYDAFFNGKSLNYQELLNNPQFNDNAYSIISLSDNSILKGGDINIVAKGINISNSNITGSGDISFTTSDGVNFVQNYNPTENNNIKFNNSNLQIANSSISSKDGSGKVNLVSDANVILDTNNITGNLDTKTSKTVHIRGNDITGNAKFEAQAVQINQTTDSAGNPKPLNTKTTVGGDLTIDTTAHTIIFNVLAANATADAGTSLVINNLTTGNLDADANYNIDLIGSTITGDVDAYAGKISGGLPDSIRNKQFYMEDTDIGGSLTATSDYGWIHLNGGSIVGDAILNANPSANLQDGKTLDGNIIIGYNGSLDKILNGTATKNSTAIGGTIQANASEWIKAYSEENLKFVDMNIAEFADLQSDKYVLLKGGNVDGAMNITANNVRINNGFPDSNTKVGGDLTVTSTGNSVLNNVSAKNTKVDAGYSAVISNLTTGNLDADANYNIDLIGSNITGDVDAYAGKISGGLPDSIRNKQFYMEDTDIGGSLTATSDYGWIHLNGGSIVGDAILNANPSANLQDGKTLDGNIIIGYNGSLDKILNGTATKNSTAIGGVIQANASEWVRAYSDGDLNFEKSNIGEEFIAESSNGHISIKNADVEGNANFTAKNGVKIWFSDFAKDLTAKFTGDSSVKVPSDAMPTDPPHDVYIAYSQVHGNANLKAPNASDAQITVSNTTIDNNLDAQSAGSVVLWQANVGKHVNAKAENGNVSLNGGDKQTEVGSINADAKQNIIINNSKVKGNANLKAGLDIRSTNSSYVGNIIANAKNGSFKDSKGDLKFYNTNIENKLSANTDGNISLDSNANNVNESLMNKIGSIDFKTEDGNIKIWDTNVSNDTKLTSNKGNILLADSYTNTANITNNEGNISVSNVKANTVNTTNNISGETVISSKGNKINELNSIAKGDAKITLNNANVGNANLNSQNGNISINSTKADNITATSTENGKISMMYSKITGKFKANANNGDIVLDADESKMNQTVGSLDLKTENGNINIWDTIVTSSAKLDAKNGNILSSNANYGGNIKADAKNANFDSSKAGKLNFVDSNITENLTATADNKVALNNSTVGGKFTGKSNNYETTVNHSTVGSAELTSKWNNSFNNSTSNGDIKMSSEGGHSTINASTIKGNAELTAKGNAAINGSTVDGNATVKATDGKASIWESIVGKKATVTSENYEAAIGASEGKTSQVGSAEITSKYNNRLYNTTVNGDAKLTSTNGHSSVSNATIKGNAELTAKGNAAINGSTVDGDATVKATDGKASIWESIVGKKATVTSENYEAAIGAGEGKTSQVGSAEIKSKWNNRLYNTTVNGDAKLTSTNGNSSVSNATIKGNAELTAKVSAAVSDSNIESNATVQSETGKASIYKSSVTGIAKVTSSKNEAAIGESQVGTADMYGETGARFYNSKSNGELKIKANTGDVNITNATVRNVNATSHKANINVKNTETTGNSRNHFTAKNGNVTSTNSNYIGSIKAEVGKTADFNTDKNITFDYVSADTLNVTSNNENIGIIGNIIADNINLTATKGSIYATTNALLDGNTYNLNALNQIASLDDISEVMNKTDYDWSLQNAINISGGRVESLSAGIASVHSNGNVTFVTPETTKGNLRLSSDGDLNINKGANVAGNLLTQANGSITTSGNIMAGFDVKAYATDDINIENVNAGRNLELKSNKGNINLGNESKASSVSGKTTLTADKDINVKNYTSTDSFNATSNNGAITLNKASVGNRAIPAGQYKGITLNAKKDINVNNSYSHGKFTANSTEGSVTVNNTGVETQGSDITAGKDVNLNQFHSAAHVNITAGENVNAKAIGTSANQSIWTVKAGKDANFENLNLNNKNGGLNVEANNININNAPSVGIKPNVQGQVDLKANNDIKIENGTEFGSKLNATAGNNISLDRKGDLTINNSSPMSLKAGNTVSVSTDGQLVIDNLTNNDVVSGKNVNYNGHSITSNNSSYVGNTTMSAKQNIKFNGDNNVSGDLRLVSSGGDVNVDGTSTYADNLKVYTTGNVTIDNVKTHPAGAVVVNNANDITINNTDTRHLAILNKEASPFNSVIITNTNADTTEFKNGNDAYLWLDSSNLFGNDRNAILSNSENVNIHFLPLGESIDNISGLDEDSALILGYLRDKAIDTRLGSDFAPIGFAAHEGRRGGLHRMDIGDSVYRALQEQIDTLHITDRFNIDQ